MTMDTAFSFFFRGEWFLVLGGFVRGAKKRMIAVRLELIAALCMCMYVCDVL